MQFVFGGHGLAEDERDPLYESVSVVGCDAEHADGEMLGAGGPVGDRGFAHRLNAPLIARWSHCSQRTRCVLEGLDRARVEEAVRAG